MSRIHRMCERTARGLEAARSKRAIDAFPPALAASDGTVTETKTLTFTEKKVYKQDWPAYNAAQSVEKDRFQELLFDLCRGLAEPERTSCGRKPHTVKDSIFAMVFKCYSTFSARRFSSDLREAHERGFLSVEIPGMKTTAFMENAEFTPILKALIAESAAISYISR